MSFGTSETYIYAYIAFASVYLIASLVFVATALRISTSLSRSRATVTTESVRPGSALAVVLAHGQRMVDYTQLSTLLPLVYIVGSMFLGSVITRDTGLARTINVGWIVFTVACAATSVGLAAMGIRESGAVNQAGDFGGHAPEALQRVGVRLGVSAALLLLVAVFTLLNLWSIIASLDTLMEVDFLL